MLFRSVGNLKFSVPPLPVEEGILSKLLDVLGARPRWLAASTHPGEEDMAAAVHRRLAGEHPGLLTVIVPRHPDRGAKITARLRGQGLDVAMRSAGDAIKPETDIYLADTMGDMGLFFRFVGIAFMGKSLVPLGGQNPLEAAKLDCAIIHGPHMMNFKDIAARLDKNSAAMEVEDEKALGDAVERLLGDEAERDRMAAAANEMAVAEAGVLDAVLGELQPFLDPLFTDEKSRARA